MTQGNDTRRRAQWTAALLGPLLAAAAAAAEAPDVFTQAGFDQRLDHQVPLSLEFQDHRGRSVALREYFGDKPVILSLVYYECPMLCTLELNGLVRSLKTLRLTPGEDFTLLTVSFDPGETTQLAARKRRSYLRQYGRDGAADGWHFFTGSRDSTSRLCEAVGFRYAYDAQRDEYAHASGIVVLTPEGRVSRYFYGIDYSARDLRLGLVEAAAGRIGSPADQLLLLCYGYDPATGKYGFLVMSAIRLGGLATVCAVGGFIGAALWREHRRRDASPGGEGEGGEGEGGEGESGEGESGEGESGAGESGAGESGAGEGESGGAGEDRT